MMPAMRAAPSTSPFLALPERTRASVFFDMATRPCAVATRSVAGLADTSTMRASPPAEMWVSLRVMLCPIVGTSADSLRGRRRARSIARQQCLGGRRHIGLPHQAFADQERADAELGEAGEIGRGKNATLADQHTVARRARGEALARRQGGL